jgi:hypothetical protein
MSRGIAKRRKSSKVRTAGSVVGHLLVLHVTPADAQPRLGKQRTAQLPLLIFDSFRRFFMREAQQFILLDLYQLGGQKTRLMKYIFWSIGERTSLMYVASLVAFLELPLKSS